MNFWLIIAGILSILLGLVHSGLGEYLIFKNKREHRKLIPTKTKTDLEERHLRIIWATWHIVSVLGIVIGILLVQVGLTNENTVLLLLPPLAYGMLVSSFLVLTATKGKHPGWIVLVVIGTLILFGT